MSLSVQAILAEDAGNLSEAIALLQRAAGHYQRADREAQSVRVLAHMGSYLTWTNALERAHEVLREATTRSHALEDLSIQAKAQQALANCLAAMGREQEARGWLERTLDDSSNRRLSLPEAFLALDGALDLMHQVASGLVVHEAMVRRNLMAELPFLATENILMECVKAGADRQGTGDCDVKTR